eukprot:7238234-Pyramimonas_sp.AAC.1
MYRLPWEPRRCPWDLCGPKEPCGCPSGSDGFPWDSYGCPKAAYGFLVDAIDVFKISYRCPLDSCGYIQEYHGFPSGVCGRATESDGFPKIILRMSSRARWMSLGFLWRPEGFPRICLVIFRGV